MSYYLLQEKKKIPSLLAYSLILMLTFGLSFFLKNNTVTNVSRASKKTIPQNITISNLTNKSASISFTTLEKSRSLIKYGTNNDLDKIKFDDRDLVAQTKRMVHFFTLDQLEPNTNYSFEINIDRQKYKEGDSFKFELKTYSSNINSASHAPVYGKILASDFQPEKEVLVNLSINKAKHLTYSSLSKKTGEWIITFPFIIQNNLSQIHLEDNDLITLNLVSSELKTSKITVKYKNAKPIKTVIIGKNYDFSIESAVMGVSSTRNVDGLILYPRDNAIINTNYPVFRGKSKPNSLVQIATQPTVFSTVVKTNNKGEWQYQANIPILAGSYELIVLDNNQNLSNSIVFHIGKSGEAVLGDATPSATITPSTSPTLSLTPIITPTTSPTTVITPTTGPTTIITLAPTQLPPTLTITPIPKSGLNNNLLILFSSGLSLFGLFLVLY